MRARFIWVVSLLAASAASAQTYVAAASSATYPALANPTPLALANDDGRATIPLGFSFPFYDRTYTSVIVTANGMLFFEPGGCSVATSSCDYPFNWAVPHPVEPNALVAPLWDDLSGSHGAGAAGVVRHEAVAGPNGQGIAIEWSDWNHWSALSSYHLTFQVRLWENGIVEFFYGPMSGQGIALSATVGMEDPTGARGTPGKACATMTSNPDGGEAFCGFADFVPQERITFGPPAPADLFSTELEVTGASSSGSDLSLSTELHLRNFGNADATGFTYRLYLSSDSVLDASDVPMQPEQGPVSLAALGATVHAAVSTVPRPASGSYHVIAVIDGSNSVPESDESNNTRATADPLLAGIDLVAEGITGPAQSDPGAPVAVSLTLSNRGIDAPASEIAFRILLSANGTLDAKDVELHRGTVPIGASQTVTQPVTFTLPANVPSGQYAYVLQLDDGPGAGVIGELDETNNIAFGSAVRVRQPELMVGPVSVADARPPHPSTELAFFGEEIRLSVAIANQGEAAAQGFTVLFYLSENDLLNGFNDPFVTQVQGLSLAPGESTVASVTAPVPTQSPGGASLVAGTYLFFAAVVSNGNFRDPVPANDLNHSALLRVRGPVADLVATSLSGPAEVGSGESFLVSRTLRNVGFADAPPARYRYFLSANTLITESDVPLAVWTPSGMAEARTVTLPEGAEDSGTDLVKIPPGTPAASYYLGVLLDPPGASAAGQVIEVSEENNGLTMQTVAVTERPLRITNPSIPDAVVGLPFEYQLAAGGGAGPYAFTLRPGAGALPEGLTLESGGRIHGVPRSPGVTGFTVVVLSGGEAAEAHLVIRAIPLTASLVVTTHSLPPVVRQLGYRGQLSAAGGMAPYRWSLESGALPPGLALDEQGAVTGGTDAPPGTFDVVVRVRDGAGSAAAKALSVRVVAPGALVIQRPALPPALAGATYLADMVVRNADGSAPERPVTWSLASGRLPAGLSLEGEAEVAFLQGTPREPGTFPFTLAVEDGQGRIDSTQLVLVVLPVSVRVHGEVPPRVAPGEAVSVRFLADESLPARFTLHSGRPPPGLALSTEGKLEGTIAPDAAPGPYTFTVAAQTSSGGRGLGTFTTEVEREAAGARPSGCGCQGSVSGPLAAAFVVTLWLPGRKRRRDFPVR